MTLGASLSGRIARRKNTRPAVLICVPHDKNPADAESDSRGADYTSHVLRGVEMRSSFAEEQPWKVLVDKLNVYVRRS